LSTTGFFFLSVSKICHSLQHYLFSFCESQHYLFAHAWLGQNIYSILTFFLSFATTPACQKKMKDVPFDFF